MKLTSLCATIAAVVLLPSTADDYPSKPIKFIVPSAPAGIGDMLASATGLSTRTPRCRSAVRIRLRLS
jgi:tripartite-type tricarboxylate transporter receptor subunit TctC